ncbi:hypothetical protein DFH28DRAFT_1122178 [Melampsora americana]|nr:hypothetical protein DFH28DRAFT_1122178 [Melampsora americana]
MLPQSLMHSTILALLASCAVVYSAGAAPKTNGTSVGGPALSTPSTNKIGGSPTNKTGGTSASKTGGATPKSDSSNSKVIACTTGWAPVGDSKKAPTTGSKTNRTAPTSSKAPHRRAADSAKPAAADNHKSLCDTAKERYTCSSSKCKAQGGQRIAQASGCKGSSKTAQCLAYRPGVQGGHISLETHTPHPTAANGWIECAAFHKIDPKAGRNQKIATIACQKLTVPMECSGCQLMNSTKIVKPGQARTIDPAEKPEPSGKPKPSGGGKTNGPASHPPLSSNSTKSGSSVKSKPSTNSKANGTANGTASAPPSSASKSPKNTQTIGSQPPKAGARQ